MWKKHEKGKKEKKSSLLSSFLKKSATKSDRSHTKPFNSVELPPEIIVSFLAFLPLKDVVRASMVCQSWRYASEDDLIWKGLYLDAQSQRRLERPLAKRSFAQDAEISWKQKYKDAFHFKKGSIGNSVEIVLHSSDTFVSGQGGVLVGEVVVHIGQNLLESSGIYLNFTGMEMMIESRENSKGEDKSWTECLVYFEDRPPLFGTDLPWEKRRQHKESMKKGTYRIPFALDFPAQAKDGKELPPTQKRTQDDLFFEVTYQLYAVLVRPGIFVSNLHSRTLPLTVLLPDDNIEKKLALKDAGSPVLLTETHKHIAGKNKVTCQVQMERDVFSLDESPHITLLIDNTCSEHRIKGVRVHLEEEWHVQGGQASVSLGYHKVKQVIEPHDSGVISLDFPLKNFIEAEGHVLHSNLVHQSFHLIVELQAPVFVLNLRMKVPIQLIA